MTPPDDPIPREVLSRAAELLGGHERLAERLHVELGDLLSWIAGEARPPAQVVFAALNIVEREKKQ